MAFLKGDDGESSIQSSSKARRFPTPDPLLSLFAEVIRKLILRDGAPKISSRLQPAPPYWGCRKSGCWGKHGQISGAVCATFHTWIHFRGPTIRRPSHGRRGTAGAMARAPPALRRYVVYQADLPHNQAGMSTSGHADKTPQEGKMGAPRSPFKMGIRSNPSLHAC